MLANFRLRLSHIFFLIILFVSAACTRITTTELGGGLIPVVDGVNTFDTIMELQTDTFEESDTTRVYNSDNMVIGAITNDPLFGRTSAELNFELAPSFYPFFVPGAKDSLVVDSAVLILSYKGFYGDSSQPLRVNVQEISSATPLSPFISYPVNHPTVYPINTIGNLGNTATIDIRMLSDSVNNRYEQSNNQIRIPLRSDVARRFLRDYDSTNAYKNDSTFKSFFKGFSVKVQASNPANALLYINLLDTNTKLALYYNTSSTGATVRDTSVTYFKFNSAASAYANYIVRNTTGAEINNHITTTSKPDSLVYVQSFPGTYVRIRIPNLQGLSNRIIHRAELVAEQVPDNNNLVTLDRYFQAPRLLLLSAFDSAKKQKRNIPNDYLVSSQGPNTVDFGGFRTFKTINGYDRVAAYNFIISRYIQGIVTRKDSSFTLRLSAPSNDSLNFTPPYPNNLVSQMYYLNAAVGNEVANGRVRLGGGTHSRFRMRLRLVYSRL
jgi:hypothetical protein